MYVYMYVHVCISHACECGLVIIMCVDVLYLYMYVTHMYYHFRILTFKSSGLSAFSRLSASAITIFLLTLASGLSILISLVRSGQTSRDWCLTSFDLFSRLRNSWSNFVAEWIKRSSHKTSK